MPPCGASMAARPSPSSSSRINSPTRSGCRRCVRSSARDAMRGSTRCRFRSRSAAPRRSSAASKRASRRSPMAVEALVAEALSRASNAEALDLALQVPDFEATPRLSYLAALACARMGAASEARSRLAAIDTAALDPALAAQVTSLAARLAKDRGDAREALERYREALRLATGAYPAVNAATMAHLLGDAATRDELARQALRLAPEQGDHWDWASRGEALLLLGRGDESARAYETARELARGRHGDVASMRRQLRLIGSAHAVRMLEVLASAQVLAFTGHMIDAPGRPAPRFPAALEGEVRSRIAAEIRRMPGAIGYSQAACGADLLFLE